MKKEPHIASWKKDKVEEIKKLIEEYPLIGIINLQNLPTPQLQRIKKQLKDKIRLVMTKRRLLKIALQQSQKKNINPLLDYLKGVSALLFTKEPPFKIFKILKQNRSSAPAKAGQTTLNDIIIPEGPTSLQPGPIIGELGQLGIVTSVESGKVTIKKDTTIVKSGEVIKQKAADVLSKLGIEPMEVGLNLVAIYENGEILTRDILDVDETAYINNLKLIYRETLSLALHIAYPNKETITYLIQKVEQEVNTLASKTKFEQTKDIKTEIKESQKQVEKLKEIIQETIEKEKEEAKEETFKEELEPPKELASPEKPKIEIQEVTYKEPTPTFQEFQEKKQITAEKILAEVKEEIKQEEIKTEKIPTITELMEFKKEGKVKKFQKFDAKGPKSEPPKAADLLKRKEQPKKEKPKINIEKLLEK